MHEYLIPQFYLTIKNLIPDESNTQAEIYWSMVKLHSLQVKLINSKTSSAFRLLVVQRLSAISWKEIK